MDSATIEHTSTPDAQLSHAELAALAETIPAAPAEDLVRVLGSADMMSLDVPKFATHLRAIIGRESVEAMIETHFIVVDEEAISGNLRVFIATPTRLIQVTPTQEESISEGEILRSSIRITPRERILGVSVDLVTCIDVDHPENTAMDYIIAGFTTGVRSSLDVDVDPEDGVTGGVSPTADITISESADYVDADTMTRVMNFIAHVTH